MKFNWKTIWRFAFNNYFISIFIAIVAFVGFVSVFKLFFTKPTYVYAEVKVGQGLWWASTQKPSIWFVNAIKNAKVEKNLIGQPSAKILGVRYYPYFDTGQYDVYVTVKIRVSGNKKTGEYSFNRSTIGVGSPIDLEFPSTQFSGTIIALSDKPLKENYVEKTVYMTKKNAYPWEYNAIKIGDSYFDGKETVFQVIDKKSQDTSLISSDAYGNSNPNLTESQMYIVVKAKMRLKQENGQLIYGEDQNVTLGRNIGIATSNFAYNNFVVSQIE